MYMYMYIYIHHTGAPLSVSSFSPSVVGVAGGADLVLSGTGFADASSSQVGGAPV